MYTITFVNHTAHSILCGVIAAHGNSLDDVEVLPGALYTFQGHRRQKRLLVQLISSAKGNREPCDEKLEGNTLEGEAILSIRSRKPSTSWRAIQVNDNCRWRVYEQLVQKARIVHIFARRDMSRFLADMADDTPLYDLCLPGTHDTMAFYGWPISQCQDLLTPLSLQLESGIRVIDIRLAVKPKSSPPQLVAFHGLYPQRTPFQDILDTIYQFLTGKGDRETIVMSLKQEDFIQTPAKDFSLLVHNEIAQSKGGFDLFVLDDRIPKLGEVRGKVVLFSRFGGKGEGWDDGLGIHPTNWPDSEKLGFEWDCNGVVVRTHDWYAIPSFLSIPEKVELSTSVLLPSAMPAPNLAISYFSAASFPLAVPPVVACGFGWPKFNLGVEGVNSRVGRWLLDALSGEQKVRGWTLMDFYECPQGGSIVPLLVECNYRWR